MALPNTKIQGGFAVPVIGLAIRAARTRNATRTFDDAFSSQMPVSPIVMTNWRFSGAPILLIGVYTTDEKRTE
jgi:hypothetical protein